MAKGKGGRHVRHSRLFSYESKHFVGSNLEKEIIAEKQFSRTLFEMFAPDAKNWPDAESTV